MKIRTFVVLLLAAALSVTPGLAGVVFEIEVKDHEQPTAESETIEAAVEGKNLKVEIAPGEGGQGEMIFRGEQREMVIVDHDERSYMVMDEAAMRGLADQVGSMMDQMQKALEGVPPEQRRTIEEMMKQRLPSQAPERPGTELRRTSETGEKAGYPCVKYDVLRDGRKVRELWVTDWDNIEGGREVGGAFEQMAGFFQEMIDTLPDFGQGRSAADTAFAHMKELGGFPVVTREFGDDGSLENESTLRSSTRRTLDPSQFEPPAGYKRRSMGPS